MKTLLILISLLILTACGGSGGSSSGTATSSSVSPVQLIVPVTLPYQLPASTGLTNIQPMTFSLNVSELNLGYSSVALEFDQNHTCTYNVNKTSTTVTVVTLTTCTLQNNTENLYPLGYDPKDLCQYCPGSIYNGYNTIAPFIGVVVNY